MLSPLSVPKKLVAVNNSVRTAFFPVQLSDFTLPKKSDSVHLTELFTGPKTVNSATFNDFMKPVLQILPDTPALESRGDRPLKLLFDNQLKSLIYYHLFEHESGRDLLQKLREDGFAKEHVAPRGGISRSGFSEAMNNRGTEQLQYVFQELCLLSHGVIPRQYADLGEIRLTDGSLIGAVLSMYWADYRKNSRKAKGHFGFDLNHGIPSAIFLTAGKGAERPFVSQILSPGQTGVMDRGYQCHDLFDTLQDEGKSFVCRIKNNTKMECVTEYTVNPDDYIFYDALVRLGTPGVNQSGKSVRVVGYRVGNAKYLIATDRPDLTAEQIALVYKLRWDIEKFFQWWKKHLKVYHLIVRSEYGVMVQLLAGLITYLLMAIYCRKHYNEPVSVVRLRQIRIAIGNELRNPPPDPLIILILLLSENVGKAYAKS